MAALGAALITAGCGSDGTPTAAAKHAPLAEKIQDACGGATIQTIAVRGASGYRARDDRYIIVCGNGSKVVVFDVEN